MQQNDTYEDGNPSHGDTIVKTGYAVNAKRFKKVNLSFSNYETVDRQAKESD